MALTKEEVLALVPQRPPFRFIDEIVELNDERIVASYVFRKEEFFYGGHFPGNPVTPGVILIEAMAQTGVVAYGIYWASKELAAEELSRILTVFTDVNVEFTGMVRPGDRVLIQARKVFYRRLKFKAEGEISLENGAKICSGTIAGMGIRQT
jgi:3-hydroxyacyl-[acyl-carrier-protein] dehydratase